MLPLFRRPPDPTIAALYGAIVAQARHAVFYQNYAVPDTVLGRFDMIVLHLVLVLRRLRDGGATQRATAQGVFDTFCRDMDDNLREMGIGDQAVPDHMRRVGAAFYGRAQAYEAALGEPADESLVAALLRNVYADCPEPQVAAGRLAIYVRRMAQHLSQQPLGRLADGTVTFPQPELAEAPELAEGPQLAEGLP
jgi:cytochrome b pre-mRNA-processing protein 3